MQCLHTFCATTTCANVCYLWGLCFIFYVFCWCLTCFFFNDVCLSFFGLSCLLGVHVFVLDICGVCVRVL